MANSCCVCGCKIGFWDDSAPIIVGKTGYILCYDCNQSLLLMKGHPTPEEYQQCEEVFMPLLSNPETPTDIKTYFINLRNKCEESNARFQAEFTRKQEAEMKYQQCYESMLLTTTSCLDGYRVAEYLDVICEEVIFKNSFMNRLSAGFEDLVNTFNFKETEMSGSSELIFRAREYVKDKFIKKAARMGANAVLGVEYESSIGSEIVRVAMFGTAVVIEQSKT